MSPSQTPNGGKSIVGARRLLQLLFIPTPWFQRLGVAVAAFLPPPRGSCSRVTAPPPENPDSGLRGSCRGRQLPKPHVWLCFSHVWDWGVGDAERPKLNGSGGEWEGLLSHAWWGHPQCWLPPLRL